MNGSQMNVITFNLFFLYCIFQKPSQSSLFQKRSSRNNQPKKGSKQYKNQFGNPIFSVYPKGGAWKKLPCCFK